MKKNYINQLLFVAFTYFSFLVLGIGFKFLFLALQWGQETVTFSEAINIIYHGLVLDSSIAAYLTAFPLLMALLATFLNFKPHWLLKIYFLLALIFYVSLQIVNGFVFRYWHFPVDSTILFYMRTPKSALASASLWEIVLGMVLFIGLIVLLYRFFIKKILPFINNLGRERKFLKSTVTSFLLIILGGVLFVAMRGGVTVSTAGVGMAYHSERDYLNYAAVNPAFSFFRSLFQERYSKYQLNFYSDEECQKLFAETQSEYAEPLESDSLLNTKRPTIILISMESFSANAVGCFGGTPNVTPNLDRISKDAIRFTRCFSTSYRTDHGLIAMHNGVSATPSASVMKYPSKTKSLPSLVRALKPLGYQGKVIYGGDIDFTNMRGYFFDTGYEFLISDKDYPRSIPRSKWGVRDEALFDKAFEEISSQDPNKSMFYSIITLSSHEPFDVPDMGFGDEYLNGIAYTDRCVGAFVDRLKTLPLWDNLLLVFMADHAYSYPKTLKEYEPERYRILQMWTGGAVKQPREFSQVVYQVDFPATLLSVLGVEGYKFPFSNVVFAPDYKHFSYYTRGSFFGCIDSTGYTVYDYAANRVLMGDTTSIEGKKRFDRGKAYLQTLYDYIKNL